MAKKTDLLGDEVIEETEATTPITDEIERWFRERIHNSPVSQSTEIFNHVRAAVDDLKDRLS